MKVGIYIWHPKGENRYCIGEWLPTGKSYQGLTAIEGGTQRIAQEIKAKNGTKQFTLDDIEIDFTEFLDFSQNREKGFDKLIHKNLRQFFGEHSQVSTEFFELPSCWKNPKDIFIDAAKKTAADKWGSFDPSRPLSFGPRKGSQDKAIAAVKAAKKNGVKKFLLGCKCRFGKTFTAYQIAKETNADNVLIMTFRPSDTYDAWLNDLNTHQDFRNYQFFNQNDIDGFLAFPGKKVLFISFQKAKKALDDFEKIKQTYFDLLVIDEDQIGAHRIENRDLIEELNKDFTLVLTGTPELEIMSNEFGDDFYKFDYIDEQHLKDSGYSEYADMPKLSLYTLDIANKFAETITDKNGFAISELFKVENDEFKYPRSIKKFLDYVSASSQDAAYDVESEDLGIFANPKFDLKHGLWKLPSIAACKKMKEALEAHNFFKGYHIEILPESDKTPKAIEKTCVANPNGTIWLTVMKNTVGVTVKQWTYTISLYGSDSSSLSSYIQFIFRAGSPGKKQFYTFDFCPSRALDVVDMFAVARCADRTNSNYDKAIAEVLNFLPVFAYNGAGRFKALTPNELFKQISYFTTARSCRNLLYKDFEIMSEYADDLAGVEVKGMAPSVAKNDALGKLKKEMERKQQSKNGAHKMTDKQFVEQAFQAFVDIYRWVNYHQGVSDIDDFISKLRGYTDCEQWFGFSDEFIQALIGVIASSKRNFGIAIERFKMLPFEFALEDVPVELAKRMVRKLDVKKESPMICDCCFAGPTLLKQVATIYPNATLFAVIPKDAHKLRAIARKELGGVNIIEELSMNFDHIIMNPPYDGSLHLKVLREAMKHSDDIVNLSPIRWLQDPLAEYKKNSDWVKYEDIRERIEELDVISAKTATQLFNAVFGTDLGIYKLNNKGGFDLSSLKNDLIVKLIPKFIKNGVIKDAPKEKLVKFTFPEIHGHVGTYDWAEVTSRVWDIANKVEPDGKRLTISFDTNEELENFYKSLFTNFYKYVISNMRCNQKVTELFRSLPFMPTYVRPWTDADLYKYFGLTDDEVKIIEEEIK